MKYQTPIGTLTIQNHCPPEDLRRWRMAESLGIFWRGDAEKQKAALVEVAGQPEGNVGIARTDDDTVVGFVAIFRPDGGQRWGRESVAGLLELGGIEVAREWRGLGVACQLLKAAFESGEYDDCIVLATGYSWCWDLEGLGIDISDYRKLLRSVFTPFGFQSYATDEPNISFYGGNVLAARVGPNVSPALFERFQELLLQDQGRPDLSIDQGIL